MIFDPMYFIIVGPFLLLALLVGGLVKLTFAKYHRMQLASGYSGAQFARRLLNSQGLSDVPIEVSQGHLSDHYDPTQRVLRLSPDVYQGTSAAAVGVAAHEAGHALQHQQGYLPLVFRNTFYPAAAFGSQSWIWLFIIGMFIGGPGSQLGGLFMTLAILAFGLYVVFAIATLPVEFNASRRALAAIKSSGIMSQQEYGGARNVLTAASLTYVASAMQAIAILFYLLLRRE